MSDDSSASGSSDCKVRVEDDTINRKRKKSKTSRKPAGPKYPIRTVCVPKRCFQQTIRKLKSQRSLVDTKKLSAEKAHCHRFILSEINGGDTENPNEQISPESTTRIMMEMRNCLLQKEYGDLAKLICMFTQMPLGTRRWYPTLIRYCLIALMYDPLAQGTGLLDLFLEGVIGCQNTHDKKSFLDDISRIPETIHVTKFNELWKEDDDDVKSNQVNAMNVKKLCAKLGRQTLNDDQSANTTNDFTHDGSSDEWESCDENDSDDESVDDAITTEAEQAVDLEEALNKLKKEFGLI